MKKIEFNVKHENWTSPYVHIEDPALDIERMEDPDSIVLPDEEVVINVSYPLTNEFDFQVREPGGWSRRRLAETVSEIYRAIYEEEAGASSPPTVGMHGPALNRDQSDGPYGIWGHVIGDLDLHSIDVSRTDDGVVVLELGIDS